MIDRWFEAFRAQPDRAVADLFSGRARLSSDLRLDTPELLYQMFPPNLADDRAQLDEALLSWLLDMRQDYQPQVRLLGFPVYAKRICDALIALQLLDLPEARHRIRADLDAWLGWLSPLRLAPERDPALECLRLLTLGQPDDRHSAMWFRLSVDPRSEYLTVALEGLRLLPNQDDARTNQMLMLQAILRHAIGIRNETSAAFFDRRFAALRGLFPRGPQHWKQVLAQAWNGFQEHTQEEEAIELGEALREKWLYDLPSHRQVPVPQEKWEHLRDEILSKDQPETLAQRLFDLLEQNHSYATATGVSHFFVRTLHNLGTLLLRQHQLGLAEMNRLGLMIERALGWEPMNPYCWMLWAEWFRAGRLPEAHEATLREMLRLFPNSVHARVELGRLLIDQGEDQWDEARHWLHQAMKQDPDSGHPQVVFARLLTLSHRRLEAIALLREFVRSHPDNQIATQSLEQLQSTPLHASRDQPPQEVVSQGGPSISLSLTTKELFRRSSLGREFNRARVAKMLGQVVSTDLIRRETRQGDPLAGFYSQWLLPKETPECPPHAWAWKACQNWQESSTSSNWIQLARQFPEASTETHFLRILAESPSRDHSSQVANWHSNCLAGADTGSPGIAFMREALERADEIDPQQRDEHAVQVMGHRAVDALGFASASVV